MKRLITSGWYADPPGSRWGWAYTVYLLPNGRKWAERTRRFK